MSRVIGYLFHGEFHHREISYGITIAEKERVYSCGRIERNDYDSKARCYRHYLLDPRWIREKIAIFDDAVPVGPDTGTINCEGRDKHPTEHSFSGS